MRIEMHNAANVHIEHSQLSTQQFGDYTVTYLHITDDMGRETTMVLYHDGHEKLKIADTR